MSWYSSKIVTIFTIFRYQNILAVGTIMLMIITFAGISYMIINWLKQVYMKRGVDDLAEKYLMNIYNKSDNICLISLVLIL